MAARPRWNEWARATPGEGAALTRRRFLASVAFGGALALGCGKVFGQGRPNLLVLVTDDQRADTLGCMGNPVARTPAIDALAADGVVFDNAFVTTSICPSSRASILTGQLTRRHRVRDFQRGLPPEALAATYPALLRAAGYRTAFFGKWGVGSAPPHGVFDAFAGFLGQGHYRHRVEGRARHLTELLASQAIDFLEQTEPGQPFCVSISFKAPHGPWTEPDPSLEGLYDGVTIPVPATALPGTRDPTLAFLRESILDRGRFVVADPEELQVLLRRYYVLIAGVDAAVGRLLEALGRLGLRDDTVVVFTSDNGLLFGEHELMGKWLMYEEAIRVPLVVRHPGLASSRRGRRIAPMALNVDLAPTLLELAGVATPRAMQGRSLVPLMEGDDPVWREDWFYEQDLRLTQGYVPTVEGVRTEDWKYVAYLDERSNAEALYDLRRDPLETSNLIGSSEHREIAEDLRGRWRRHRESA